MPEPSCSDLPVSVVAVHQPNYAPWLGYFHKIACADHFVFLDNVQFSRLSYTNRVQIAGAGPARWLTQPVRRRFGQPICDVRFADVRWPTRHLDALRGTYGQAAFFRDVWDAVVSMYESIPPGGLAVANQFLIESLVRSLGLACAFCRSSDHTVGDMRPDDRIIALVGAVAPGATYLSGKGGAGYQDSERFAAAGVPLRYVSFEHPVYPRGNADFHPGLSILDVVFHLGWESARSLIVDSPASGDGAEVMS